MDGTDSKYRYQLDCSNVSFHIGPPCMTIAQCASCKLSAAESMFRILVSIGIGRHSCSTAIVCNNRSPMLLPEEILRKSKKKLQVVRIQDKSKYRHQRTQLFTAVHALLIVCNNRSHTDAPVEIQEKLQVVSNVKQSKYWHRRTTQLLHCSACTAYRLQ